MKVRVDEAKCEAHGRCYDFYPELFERGAKGKSVALMNDVPEDDPDLMRAAEAASMMCPAGAIVVEDE